MAGENNNYFYFKTFSNFSEFHFRFYYNHNNKNLLTNPKIN